MYSYTNAVTRLITVVLIPPTPLIVLIPSLVMRRLVAVPIARPPGRKRELVDSTR